MKNILLLLTVVVAVTVPAGSETTAVPDVSRVVSWLPADTETLIVADLRRGSVFSLRDARDENHPQVSLRQVSSEFVFLPLQLLGIKEGAISRFFQDIRILLAVEGARHFRAPSALGPSKFEGCEFVFFDRPIASAQRAFLQSLQQLGGHSKLVRGKPVAVLTDEVENDTWLFFLAFPASNLMAMCSDDAYLAEVLMRMENQSSSRAFLSELTEWNHVKRDAPFWGIRHLARNQAGRDVSYQFSLVISEEKTTGITFDFDPTKATAVHVTVVSGDNSILEKAKKDDSSLDNEPDSKGIRTSYREVSAGIVECNYEFATSQALRLFMWVFAAKLGHATII